MKIPFCKIREHDAVGAVARHGWLAALVGICLLMGAQYSASKDVETRIGDLRGSMSETQTLVLQLTRRIGYGGMIHNFKNSVLRAEDDRFYAAGLDDADRAGALVDRLEAEAATLGFPFVLERTRSMIATYRMSLEDVRRLHTQGESPLSIDRAVRYDDQYAIREIDTLLDGLAGIVQTQVDEIEREAGLLRTIRVVGVIVLGALVLTLLLNHRQSRRHLSAMGQMNRQLESSNAGLQTANKGLQQFAAMASHDLRSPLRHIGLFGELLQEDSAEPELVREYSDKIAASVQRLDRLVQSLLDFAQTGFTEPRLETVDVAELVDGVVQELRPQLAASGGQVNVRAEGLVMADPELLRRALHNLLGNSLKYVASGTSPVVDVSATVNGELMEFVIADNGIGIDPRFAQRIFEPCQRLHRAESEYAGSGIGLSLVKAVVESHGGAIRLDPDHVGGARFLFGLDAAEDVLLEQAA